MNRIAQLLCIVKTLEHAAPYECGQAFLAAREHNEEQLGHWVDQALGQVPKQALDHSRVVSERGRAAGQKYRKLQAARTHNRRRNDKKNRLFCDGAIGTSNRRGT